MTVRPFGTRVTVGEMSSVETVRDSGIVLPATLEERKGLVKGLVLAIGEHPMDISIENHVSVGDTVYYRENSAYDINGTVVINMHDIIAVEAPAEDWKPGDAN